MAKDLEIKFYGDWLKEQSIFRLESISDSQLKMLEEYHIENRASFFTEAPGDKKCTTGLHEWRYSINIWKNFLIVDWMLWNVLSFISLQVFQREIGCGCFSCGLPAWPGNWSRQHFLHYNPMVHDLFLNKITISPKTLMVQ